MNSSINEKVIDQTIGLRKIAKLKAKEGQAWSIVVYVLSNEVVDGFHGLWFFIGTYSKRKEAVSRAEELIKETGISSIYAMSTCQWREIDENFKADRTIFVKDDIDKKLRKVQKEQQNKLRKKYEDEQLMKEEMEEMIKYEQEEGTIEHYTRQWYLLIKQYDKINYMKEQLKLENENYEKMIKNIQELQNKYPNLESSKSEEEDDEKGDNEDEERSDKQKSDWIERLKVTLPKRGEEDLLKYIIEKHQLISQEITEKN